jgi:hypothetical protein
MDDLSGWGNATTSQELRGMGHGLYGDNRTARLNATGNNVNGAQGTLKCDQCREKRKRVRNDSCHPDSYSANTVIPVCRALSAPHITSLHTV